MKFLSLKRNKKPVLPASVSLGLHISEDKALRPRYYIMRSLIALAGIMGTLMSFVTAWEAKHIYSFNARYVILTAAICWLIFSLIFSAREKFRSLSKSCAFGSVAIILLLALFLKDRLVIGYMNGANRFMAAIFLKFQETPPFSIDPQYADYADSCMELALCFTAVLISLVVCLGIVRKPNSLLFWAATFPLPELCLYFGLVPNHITFGLLMIAWCGVFAAELTEYNTFSDTERGAARLFAKTASQSGTVAAALMLFSFIGALTAARNYERPEKLDMIRTGFIEYMKDFTWEKFMEDVTDSVFPSDKRTATHDGKLGNVDSLEFSGRNMLEVTLPDNVDVLYLKGFTGVHYGGSRWTDGPQLPPLKTPLTSPELFSGRGLKYVDGITQLRLEDVIVRNTGIANTTKYYPSNAAGLLETDGTRRRYGVYFPDEGTWMNTVLQNADSIEYPDDMAEDELRMRNYAYTYCLDVPATFTAAEEFFADYSGDSLTDELYYIRKKLASDYEYTLDSGKKPFASDFAQWFLTENKKGSCTHFASSAVLLCRSRGIPARYCEGFIIKPEDIKSYPAENGFVTMSVPDNRAHAWTEIYIDGYGWLRYEVTPGYGNVAFLPADDNWEETSASEITSVSTEPPVFSEHITSETVSMTETASAAVTEITTEITVSVTIDTENSGEHDIEASVEPSGNGDIQTNAPAENGELPPPDENNTDDQQEYSPSEYQPEMTSVSVTTANNEESTEQLKKGIDPKTAELLIRISSVIAVIALICCVFYARRKLVLAHRRKLTEKAPEKAAVQLYHMLTRLAAKRGADIRISTDIMAEKFAELEGFDRPHCSAVINTALKARFGTGITSDEARISIDAYNYISSKLFVGKIRHFIAVWIICNDKYV